MFRVKIFISALVCIMLLPTSRAGAQEGTQGTSSAPAAIAAQEDLILTVRLSPTVKPETVQAINQVTVPKTVTLKPGQSVRLLLKQVYGDFYERITPLVRRYNPGLAGDNPSEVVEVSLPAGGNYFLNVVKLRTGGSLVAQSSWQTGLGTRKAAKEVEDYTEWLIKYCKSNACVPNEASVLRSERAVAFPFVSRYVSYRIRPEARGAIPALLEVLKKDGGVTEAEVNTPSMLIPHFNSSALTSFGRACAVQTDNPGWPINALSLAGDRFPLELLSRSNEVTVAVFDSGISRDDPRFNLWRNPLEYGGVDGVDDDYNRLVDDKIGWNFIKPSDFPLDDQFSGDDYYDHGTHVAGLAAGRFLPEPLLAAVNARLHLMILKIADSRGSVNYGAVNDAIIYAQEKQARVVNMSFEGSFSPSIRRFIMEDIARVYVVAAGNGSRQLRTGLNLDLAENERYPAELAAELTNVISVAAHNEAGQLACFSNYGATTVDLAAPGTEIESTVSEGGLLRLSGTSQAAPLVSLTAALLFSQGVTEPSLIKQRILASVDYVKEYRHKLTSEGKLNVAKAVSMNHDVVELNAGTDRLKRGTLVGLPREISIGGETIPFRAVKKIVSYSPEAGAPAQQRVTWLKDGKLKHVYGNLSLPTFKLKVGGVCEDISFADVADIVPALMPLAPGQCPAN